MEDHEMDVINDPGSPSRSGSKLRNLFTSLKNRVQEPTPSDAPSSKHYFDSVNMYGNIDDNDLPEESDEEASHPDSATVPLAESDDSIPNASSSSEYRPRGGRLSIFKRLWNFFVQQQDWVFLVVLGLFSAVIALAIEESIRLISKGRTLLINVTDNSFASFLLWTLLSLFLALMAGAVVHFVGPFSAGSGIPAMKSILSGVRLKHYLSYRTLVSKAIGIILAYSSGLFVGKEGPYVHMCAALAYQLSRLSIFQRIKKNEGLRFQSVAAGCAAGLAVTFGAPVGGVLFSIEVTSTYYLIANMSKAFFTAVCATLFVRVLSYDGLLAFFSQTHFPDDEPYKSYELIPFVIIGVLFGLLSVAFIRFVEFWSRFKTRYRILNDSRYAGLLFVTFITCCVVFPIEPLRGGSTHVLDELFTMGPLSDPWKVPTIYFMLPMFALLQVGLTAFSLGLPIPAGLVTPIFIAGAAAGRLVGEIIKDTSGITTIHPASYAVVGAAALTSGVTRTLATSIVVFELTGQMSLLMPVLLVVLISITVASFFCPSIYDIQLQMKGLPYMPPFKPHGRRTAREIMRSEIVFLTLDSNYHNLESVLRLSAFESFPLVESNDNHYLLGTVPRRRLERMLDAHEKKFEELKRVYEEEMENYKEQQSAQSSSPAAAVPAVYTATGDLASSGGVLTRSPIEAIRPVMPPSRDEFFGRRLGLSRETPGFDPCPFQVVADTALSKLHFMFAMLGPSYALVLERGRLVGAITKKDMMAAGEDQA